MRQRDVDCVEEKGRGKKQKKKKHTLPLPSPRAFRQWDILIFGLLNMALRLIRETDQSYQLTFQHRVSAAGEQEANLSSFLSHTNINTHLHKQYRTNAWTHTKINLNKFKTYIEITGFSSQKRVILQCQGYHNKELYSSGLYLEMIWAEWGQRCLFWPGVTGSSRPQSNSRKGKHVVLRTASDTETNSLKLSSKYIKS